MVQRLCYEDHSQHPLPDPKALVAASKGIQAVKLLQQNPAVLNWGAADTG